MFPYFQHATMMNKRNILNRFSEFLINNKYTIKTHISTPGAYYIFKFFIQVLIGCGYLKEDHAYLIFRKLRNIIISCMQVYGENKLLSC